LRSTFPPHTAAMGDAPQAVVDSLLLLIQRGVRARGGIGVTESVATAFGTRKGKKDLAKCQKRCGKDAIFYIQVFGHRLSRKVFYCCLNTCERDCR